MLCREDDLIIMNTSCSGTPGREGRTPDGEKGAAVGHEKIKKE